jgi:TonB family protein
VRYPRIAEAMGLEGMVVVRFRIDRDGRAREVRVIQGVDEVLDDAAVAAVRAAEPFVSPEGWVRVPVQFSQRSAP